MSDKKKEGNELLGKAVADAKALREAALEVAKNELVESMAPGLRRLIENDIRGVLSEDSDRLRRGIQDNWPGESHTGFEEAKKGEEEMPDKMEKELDLESLSGFFAEADEPEVKDDEEKMEASIPTLGEGEDKDEDDKVEEGVDETVVEMNEEELKRVYDAALKTEVQVKKGFSDMTPMGELEDVVKDADKGVADIKVKSDTPWEEQEPTAKQDWTVKEVRQLVAAGMAENKALRENLNKALKLVDTLGKKLAETNLFNAKVLHANRILNSGKLSAGERKVALESLDKAKSVEQVRMVYETLTKSFAAAKQQLAESNTQRPRLGSSQARGTLGTSKVISESADHNQDATVRRLQELAGLIK